jgi:hypothetical protein
MYFDPRRRGRKLRSRYYEGKVGYLTWNVAEYSYENQE